MSDRLLDDIEFIRQNNNYNWMDIVRVAMKAAPSATKKILRKINKNDIKISEAWGKLAK